MFTYNRYNVCMHILLVSACEKRAIRRTRAVVDSYARRVGPGTWATPITAEGMQEMRTALRRSATRQTSVACFINEGRDRMRLLWVVGSRDQFDRHGAYPAGTRRASRQPTPAWIRATCLAATAAGYAHDFGKASILFQKKLRSATPVADWLRHEHVSVNLMRQLRSGIDWTDSWRSAFEVRKHPALNLKLDSSHSVVDAIVATHHRMLPASLTVGDPPSVSEISFAGSLPNSCISRWLGVEKRLAEHVGELDPSGLRALYLFARAAFIFADHTVSSRTFDKPCSGLIANSAGQQPLDWHLQQVGDKAGEVAYRMLTMRLPGLSDTSVASILQPALVGRFCWQDQGVDTLRSLRGENQSPVLVLNLAGTGSGKTRACAKFACALREGQSVRFATVMNLRSLTLQTGAAYSQQLDISADECSVVIGDETVRRLYENGLSRNDDDNPDELEFIATGDFECPDWMDEWATRHSSLRSVVGAPVLVATTDYVIAAGDPSAQGHHVSALFRLLDSDLILDEIDGYDPRQLLAILRLVQMAALCGRNVICSSATLSFPVAEKLMRSFESGVVMRNSLMNTGDTSTVVMVSDRVPPKIAGHGMEDYRRYVATMFAGNELAYRKYDIATPVARGSQAWFDCIRGAAEKLHSSNGWDFPGGKKVSFGLVRVANIHVAISLAGHLADAMPHAAVCCYHANEFLIARHLKEVTLDRLLTRHSGNQHIMADEGIRAVVASAPGQDVLFIVVATPVEEIGRDHDFDWAVIEPSSTQSIVQTSGRVNRHRLVEVIKPNVSLLEANYRALCQDKPKIVFCRPGFESEGLPYGKPWSMSHLIGSQDGVVGAWMRFDYKSCPFAEKDDKSITSATSGFVDGFVLDAHYFLETTDYERNRLRERDLKETWFLDGGRFKRQNIVMGHRGAETSVVDAHLSMRIELEYRKNAWMSYSEAEMLEACEKAGIPARQGLAVDLRMAENGKMPTWHPDFGFSGPR